MPDMVMSRALLEVVERIGRAYSPVFHKLFQLLNVSIDRSVAAIESGEIDVIRREAERQELELRMAEGQARVAQEIAIARRIETAELVEMEEFYDYSGDGHLGMRADQSQFTLGAGGSGRRVNKRIYRFTGTTKTPRKSRPKSIESLPSKTEPHPTSDERFAPSPEQ